MKIIEERTYTFQAHELDQVERICHRLIISPEGWYMYRGSINCTKLEPIEDKILNNNMFFVTLRRVINE